MPTYIITGANRGLGLEFVRQLSPSNTIIAGVRSLSADLSNLKALQKPHTENIHILECDTSSTLSIAEFVKKVPSILKEGAKIDYLFNNAGINSVSNETSLSMTQDGLFRDINVNVLGSAKMVEFLFNAGLLGKGSVVMNMTSGLGSVARSREMKPTKCTTYSISKTAVNMLTVHQAYELGGEGVRVICMDPGWVKTDMGGEGAALEKEDSIGGMLRVVHGLGEVETGKAFVYSGEEMPW